MYMSLGKPSPASVAAETEAVVKAGAVAVSEELSPFFCANVPVKRFSS